MIFYGIPSDQLIILEKFGDLHHFRVVSDNRLDANFCLVRIAEILQPPDLGQERKILNIDRYREFRLSLRPLLLLLPLLCFHKFGKLSLLT